jgi:hypothetical protein
MARMSDGRIYVGLLPFSLDFTCASCRLDWDGDEDED